jgi:deoxyribodipyrimidine photo-lyase
MHQVPAIRIRALNRAPIQPSGHFVLYWMIANRRLTANFSLDRALELCSELHKPLVIFEALRCDYPWASDRLHGFVLDGMAENAAACERYGITCFCYLEPARGSASGLLQSLAADACAVVTDDFPCFFLPRMVNAAAAKLHVLLEAVDSNGLLPLRATEQVFARAFDFRRYLQKTLPDHISHVPRNNPLLSAPIARHATLPAAIAKRWPPANKDVLKKGRRLLARLPIDHQTPPVAIEGGHSAGRRRLMGFLRRKLSRYTDERSEPDLDATSGLSPYLHFGHLSPHEIFLELADLEHWRPGKLPLQSTGAREGWWNMSAPAENFLDQLVTWREAGFNFSSHRADYDRYDSLPPWAQATLQEHARDERERVYTLEQFESATTHDPLWNAAQNQIVREGRMHNYMRMLWGKKILEWSRSPREAARIMIELNNKYGIDGRDPNSYSGIFWVLGRYDRPWGPERPVFGTVRYMSSQNTARKLSVRIYLEKYARKQPQDSSAGLSSVSER